MWKSSKNKLQKRDWMKIYVRFSMRNLDMSGNILNVPIFMTEYIDKLIQIGEKRDWFFI